MTQKLEEGNGITSQAGAQPSQIYPAQNSANIAVEVAFSTGFELLGHS
jgi:hypothetical protein